MRVCPHCGFRSEERVCPRDGLPLVEEGLFQPADTGAGMVGRVFGDRYEVQDLIGRGGMGWVFRARHLVIEQIVAVKVMRKALAQDLAAVKRFYQEARACSRLRHHNTIKVFDFGLSEDGHPYIVMEYLEGRSLSARLENEGALPAPRAARIARQICKSLHEAHEMGLVHRDLKPANIFLTEMLGEPDYVKVLDFGTAKFVEGQTDQSLTLTGIVVGTPTYMSPEQIRGRRLDRRSDIYSLGIVLFEMLSGRVPFQADTTAEMLAKQLHDRPPPVASVLPRGAAVPPALAKLVDRMLAKDPDERPATTIDVLALLDVAVPPMANAPAGADPSATVQAPALAPAVRPPAGSAPSLPSGEALPSVSVRVRASGPPPPTGPAPAAAPPPAAAGAPAEDQRVPTARLSAGDVQRDQEDRGRVTILDVSSLQPPPERRAPIAQKETAPADRPRGTLKLPPRRGSSGAWWALPALLAVAAIAIVVFALPADDGSSGPPPAAPAVAADAARLVGAGAAPGAAEPAPEAAVAGVAGPGPDAAAGAAPATPAAAAAEAAAAAVAVAPIAPPPPLPPDDVVAAGPDAGGARPVALAPTDEPPAVELDLEEPPEPPAPAPPAAITLEVESDPAGAEVWEDGVRIGTTPLPLDGAPGSTRTLVLRRAGYGELRAVVTFDQPDTYWLVLPDAGEAPPAPKRKPRKPKPKPRPEAAPVPGDGAEEPKPEPPQPKPILFD